MLTKYPEPAAAATLERRAEPRTKTSQSVLFKTPNAVPVEACMLDVSSHGTRLRASAPIQVGAAIKIETDGMLLYGNVVRCKPAGGAYDVGVLLSRPLEMLSELCRLNASVLIESAPRAYEDHSSGG